MAEIGGLYEGAQVNSIGLIAGTCVASGMGWRPVEAIAPGDMVLSFDHGMVPVRDVTRTTLWPCAIRIPEASWPVFVPAGALNNAQDMTLLPDQPVMVESDAALDAHGDPFALVQAKALEGLRGIERTAPLREIEVITLTFDTDQVIYAQGGLLAYCPCPHIALADVVAGAQQPYEVLNLSDAAFLASCIAIEDGRAAATG
ncbi:MAG: Hint domain-containing protein [Pseudomonadota bacterium]